MAILEVSNDQLRLIQSALDLYARIGILQFERILEHPSIDNIITENNTTKKKLEVGDRTTRGEIVEIGKKYIKTEGSWGNGKEIRKHTDIKNIKLSPDWNKIYQTRDEIRLRFNSIKNIISDMDLSNGSLGIHHTKVDESCRTAFDMIQVIRHEFWKEDPNRSNITVDSSVHLINGENNIKVKLDDITDIRKRKMKKMDNI